MPCRQRPAPTRAARTLEHVFPLFEDANVVAGQMITVDGAS
jgi:hypothetical protein